ncbi:50S ribosomal protein L35 [Candidatus Aerophobetes bacterium]|uniref:Large ribosomal subunit protein bL35 n=1 Tax=Aerophobetes bacterium TaxID=2030807 RepID=A0A662D725_UNCAE|nr:MAG: 50S ribosomal protein L35 [Candidatus Aerophobetes bacterium]
MPKLKSHRGLMKRLKKTGKGKIKRSRAYAGHLRRKKSSKKKRKIRKSVLLSKEDTKRVKRLIPYI